jgi:hypothetical protein
VLTQTRIARSENCNKSGARVAWLLAGLHRMTVAEPAIWSRVQADAGDLVAGGDGVECNLGACGCRWRCQNVMAACAGQGERAGGARGTCLARREALVGGVVELPFCW